MLSSPLTVLGHAGCSGHPPASGQKPSQNSGRLPDIAGGERPLPPRASGAVVDGSLWRTAVNSTSVDCPSQLDPHRRMIARSLAYSNIPIHVAAALTNSRVYEVSRFVPKRRSRFITRIDHVPSRQDNEAQPIGVAVGRQLIERQLG